MRETPLERRVRCANEVSHPVWPWRSMSGVPSSRPPWSDTGGEIYHALRRPTVVSMHRCGRGYGRCGGRPGRAIRSRPGVAQGTTYCSANSRRFAHAMVDAGADLVVGSGPARHPRHRALPRPADRLLDGQLRRPQDFGTGARSRSARSCASAARRRRASPAARWVSLPSTARAPRAPTRRTPALAWSSSSRARISGRRRPGSTADGTIRP